MAARQKQQVIEIDYRPRAAFMPFHNRTQRFACLVAHRRAGKTVAAVNDTLKRALLKKGDYAYIAPYRAQAKAVAWDYIKRYAHDVKESANEAELIVKLRTGSTMRLFGADNADAMRGLGFDGVYLDEYGDFRPSVWGNVIRPTLSDRLGWAVFAGTPKGHNQFHDIYRVASDPRNTEDWFCLMLKASASRLIADSELTAARQQLSADQYEQEYECSFDAAILGAFYGQEMSRVDAEQRIRSVPYDPDFPVNTAWDLGYTDDASIWWYQNVANEVRVLDHFSESGGTIEDFSGDRFQPGSLIKEILKRPYRYGRHWFPHDAKAKTLASDGKSVIEKVAKYLGIESLGIVPNLSVQDGIQAVRSVLPRCYFDQKCNADSQSGVEALRQYQREYDEDKKSFRKVPLHSWASHPADAFRMMAVAERRVVASSPVVFDSGKTMNEITLDELWEIHEERLMEVQKI